ncbi:hypothetical protein H5410_054769 [Solanum commersonii]|uniref:Uncharacterized protein n=1 Tax=Solanum commersonii TaxID=4109 RepID=A0A9J5WFU0_SOLCO|nr:hypothetical protein H5410_054769 [Solanum commersonii]
MGEPSNASMHLNFFPPKLTDRCDQLQDAVHYCTQIVNNNIMGDERVGELHSDEPLEHELTDNDEMYEDDVDDDVDDAPNAPVEYQSINHHSTVISYLDHTEESAEDFIYTRDDGSIRSALWNPNNPKYSQSSSIVGN